MFLCRQLPPLSGSGARGEELLLLEEEIKGKRFEMIM